MCERPKRRTSHVLYHYNHTQTSRRISRTDGSIMLPGSLIYLILWYITIGELQGPKYGKQIRDIRCKTRCSSCLDCTVFLKILSLHVVSACGIRWSHLSSSRHALHYVLMKGSIAAEWVYHLASCVGIVSVDWFGAMFWWSRHLAN